MTDELDGIPESYGTRNCYDCGAEPVEGFGFWERFIIIDGRQWSVPQCDICMNHMFHDNRKA